MIFAIWLHCSPLVQARSCGLKLSKSYQWPSTAETVYLENGSRPSERLITSLASIVLREALGLQVFVSDTSFLNAPTGPSAKMAIYDARAVSMMTTVGGPAVYLPLGHVEQYGLYVDAASVRNASFEVFLDDWRAYRTETALRIFREAANNVMSNVTQLCDNCAINVWKPPYCKGGSQCVIIWTSSDDAENKTLAELIVAAQLNLSFYSLSTPPLSFVDRLLAVAMPILMFASLSDLLQYSCDDSSCLVRVQFPSPQYSSTDSSRSSSDVLDFPIVEIMKGWRISPSIPTAEGRFENFIKKFRVIKSQLKELMVLYSTSQSYDDAACQWLLSHIDTVNSWVSPRRSCGPTDYLTTVSHCAGTTRTVIARLLPLSTCVEESTPSTLFFECDHIPAQSIHGIVMFALAGFSALASLVLLFYYIYSRGGRESESQILVGMGGVLVWVAVCLSIGSQERNLVCITGWWIKSIGIFLMLGGLSFKASANRRLVVSSLPASKTNLVLLLCFEFLLFLGLLVYITSQRGFDSQTRQLLLFNGEYVAENYCATDTNRDAIMAVLVLLVVAVYGFYSALSTYRVTIHARGRQTPYLSKAMLRLVVMYTLFLILLVGRLVIASIFTNIVTHLVIHNALHIVLIDACVLVYVLPVLETSGTFCCRAGIVQPVDDDLSESLTSASEVDMAEVLSDPLLMAYFKKYCDAQHDSENIGLLQAVQKLLNLIRKRASVDSVLTEAHNIFNQFISDSAPDQVNVSFELRRSLREDLENLTASWRSNTGPSLADMRLPSITPSTITNTTFTKSAQSSFKHGHGMPGSVTESPAGSVVPSPKRHPRRARRVVTDDDSDEDTPDGGTRRGSELPLAREISIIPPEGDNKEFLGYKANDDANQRRWSRSSAFGSTRKLGAKKEKEGNEDQEDPDAIPLKSRFRKMSTEGLAGEMREFQVYPGSSIDVMYARLQSLFDPAICEVLSLMNLNAFKRFLASELAKEARMVDVWARRFDQLDEYVQAAVINRFAVRLQNGNTRPTIVVIPVSDKTLAQPSSGQSQKLIEPNLPRQLSPPVELGEILQRCLDTPMFTEELVSKTPRSPKSRSPRSPRSKVKSPGSHRSAKRVSGD